jgi:hypothetical protein
MQQGIHQRTGADAGAHVTCHSRGLVNHRQIRVAIDDVDREILGNWEVGRSGFIAGFEVDPVSRAQEVP